MATRRRVAEIELFGPEYTVVRLRASWTTLAYVCIVLSMTARYWMRWIPFEHGWRRPFVTVLAMLALSSVGTVSAWWAHRQDASGIHKIALLCNLVALGLSLLAILVVAVIAPSI